MNNTIITATSVVEMEVEHLAQPQILKDFIGAIKSEFKDENWDYLDFIADRVISRQTKVEHNSWDEAKQEAKTKFNLLPNKEDLVESYWINDYIKQHYRLIKK